jgi:hypothetical protein
VSRVAWSDPLPLLIESSKLLNLTSRILSCLTCFQVLELLHALYCRLHDWRFISPEINGVTNQDDFNKLWVQTWLLVLHSFSRLLDDHRHHDLSSQGFGLLEKALLHPEDCAAGPSHWLQCFRCVIGVGPIPNHSFIVMHLVFVCSEVVFPVVNAKFESRGPKSSDNFRMRLFVLVTSAFATHAKNMATLEDFPALWLQLLTHMCVPLHILIFPRISSSYFSVAIGPIKSENWMTPRHTPVPLR